MGLAGASNAFAAAPSRAASGGALLANDPHGALSAPALWYLTRLELETGGLIGATIPGLPLILSGRSTALGWAITSSYIDDQDLILETVDPISRNIMSEQWTQNLSVGRLLSKSEMSNR